MKLRSDAERLWRRKRRREVKAGNALWRRRPIGPGINARDPHPFAHRQETARWARAVAARRAITQGHGDKRQTIIANLFLLAAHVAMPRALVELMRGVMRLNSGLRMGLRIQLHFNMQGRMKAMLRKRVPNA